MVTQFDTSGLGNMGGGEVPKSNGSTNTIIWVVVALIGGYLAYTYLIKPKLEKNKEEKE